LLLAQEWWRLQRYDEAMRAYHEVHALTLIHTGDQAARLRAGLGLGRYYLQIRQPEQAESLFEGALELAREQENQEAEVECLYSLGHTAVLRGEPRHALHLAEQARNIFRERADRIGEAAVLTLLAAAHTELGHFEQAASLHQLGIMLAREWNDISTEAAHLANLGILQARKLSQQEQGMAGLHRALTLFQEQANGEAAAQTLALLASVALAQQQWEEARLYAEQALPIAQGMKWLETRLHFLRADAYAGLGQKEESLLERGRAFASLFPNKAPLFEMLFQGHEALLTEARARGDMREEASQLLFLAHGQLNAGDLRGYLALYEQALALFRELGDLETLAAQLVELGVGLALSRTGRLRSKRARALGYWRAGLALRSLQTDDPAISTIDRILSSLGADPPPRFGEENELSRARARWGEAAFQKAWRASDRYYDAWMASCAHLTGNAAE